MVSGRREVPVPGTVEGQAGQPDHSTDQRSLHLVCKKVYRVVVPSRNGPQTRLDTTGVRVDDAEHAEHAEDAEDDGGDLRPRLSPVVVLACLVLAFRGALLMQQGIFFGGLKASTCPEPTFVLSGISPKVIGLDACTGSPALTSALVGIFGALLLAVPLLFVFRFLEQRRADGMPFPRHRVLRSFAVFVYLLTLAMIAEVIAGSVVMSLFGHGEADAAIRHGAPVAVLVLSGLIIAALVYPLLRSTSHLFVVDLLGHHADHVPVMQKAVLFKLTAGVALLSLTRFVLG